MTVPAAIPENELERIGALHALDILDTEPEAVFDHLVMLATSICQAQIGLVSLVDENRQWFKARVAIGATELPRDIAFCAHAITGDDMLVVPDASQDSRFARNPLVTGEPGIRSYAGALLIDKDGYKLGTICAIHTSEQVTLSDHQLEQMRHLGQIASNIMAARQRTKIRVEEQKKKAEWLKLAAQVAKIGYWTINARTNEVFWSDEQYELHGSTHADFVPEFDTAINLFHQDDRDNVRSCITETIATKSPRELDARMRRADGSERIIHSKMIGRLDDNGDVAEVFCLSQDITELRHSEAALKQSEERFALAALSSSVGIYDRQDMDSQELYWSDQHYRLLGYEPGGIEPTLPNFCALLHPDDRERFSRERERHMSTREPLRGEFRLKHKTKGYRWFLLTAQAAWDEKGNPTRLSGSIMDIDELKQAQDGIQRAQKIEAAGQLTGGIAHDFNDLLSVMLGNLELLEGDPDHPQRAEFIRNALRSAHRGSQLTHQLLAFGRRTDLKPTVFRLNDVIGDMGELLRSTVPATIKLNISMADGLAAIKADRGQMENALLNLVINARDAMGSGGTLSIETANIRLDKDHTLSRDDNLEPGSYIMVAITDTGAGIPANVLHKVFDPFFTTKDAGNGSGLGLSMVHGFVKQSGGTVRIYSEVGIGTTVILYFAASSLDEHDNPSKPAEVITELGGNERILVVEDEEDVRQITVMQLQSLGYDVTEARDGATAADVLRAQGPFDLLLTDIVMPGDLQGPDVAQDARALDPQQRVIFISGYPNDATIDGSGLRSDDIQLMKPVARSHLAQTIRKVLGNH